MIQQTDGVYRITARSPLADGIMITLFIAGTIFLFAGIEKPVMWGAVGIGIACIVAGVLLITVFKFKKLVAEVSEEGIRESASKVSKGIIRWDEIESIRIYTSKGAIYTNKGAMINKNKKYRQSDNFKFVGIYLVDPDAYAEKLNIIQKGIMKAALKMDYAPISIPCNLLGDDAEALVEICREKVNSG